MLTNPNFPISNEKPYVRTLWLGLGLANVLACAFFVEQAFVGAFSVSNACIGVIACITWFAYGFVSHRIVGASCLVAFFIYESFSSPTVNVWLSSIYSAFLIYKFWKQVQMEQISAPPPVDSLPEKATDRAQFVSNS